MSHDQNPPSEDATLDLTPLLYPELYDEGEVEQARAALARSPRAQRELERLTQGLERIRVTSAHHAARLGESVSLSAQQRHAILREAQRAHAHTKRLTKRPASASFSEHIKAFFFSPQLAWVGVLGLMTVSVWRYQQSLELSERPPLTPEVLSQPDLAAPMTGQGLSADTPAELDDEAREVEEREEREETKREDRVEGVQGEAPPSPKPQAQGPQARTGEASAQRRQVSSRRSARRRAKPIAPSARSKGSKDSKRSKRSRGKASKRDVWRSKAKSSKLKRSPKPTPPKEARVKREPTQQAQFAPPPPAPKTYAPPPPPPPPPPSPYPAQSETLSLGGSPAPSSEASSEASSKASSPSRATSTRSTEDLIASVSSAPWAEAEAHDRAGRPQEAISALEGWLTEHMSHPRAREAARLGQRWAKEQSDGAAERRFTAYLRALERRGGAGGGKQSSPRKRRLKSKSKSTMSF